MHRDMAIYILATINTKQDAYINKTRKYFLKELVQEDPGDLECLQYLLHHTVQSEELCNTINYIARQFFSFSFTVIISILIITKLLSIIIVYTKSGTSFIHPHCACLGSIDYMLTAK